MVKWKDHGSIVLSGLIVGVAAIVLVLLFGLVSLTATGFRYIHRTAGRLMIPYQLWLLFAGYLNIGVYLLNRG